MKKPIVIWTDNVVVREVNPVSFPVSSPGETTVINAGPSTVYYKDDATVTPASNEGSIASGSSVTFTKGVHWFICAPTLTSRLFVSQRIK